MIIEKTALIKECCRSKMYFLDNARQGEILILRHYAQQYTLLLPAYIGYSTKEGSGIFDPVIETRIKYRFYRINKDLSIDVDDLNKILNNTIGKKIILLVHYFGYPDKKIEHIVEICRAYDTLVIEDAAHALYTDYVDHKCGHYGDFVLYSIHKMLPYDGGGILKINKSKIDFQPKYFTEDNSYSSIFDYNFYKIAEKRKRNARLWEELLLTIPGSRIVLLRTDYRDITPQTYPILIIDYDRNQLYFKLNEAGFGAVSLYHTMIEPIHENYEDSVWISNHILNLPVHQDICGDDIKLMFENMMKILN